MSRSSLVDTIAAAATPSGAGALAVIRVSGPGAIALAGRVFRGGRDLGSLGGFEGTHGWIHDEAGPADEVVAWVYRAPRSYTGEDMVEISCHGGAVSSRRVLAALRAQGARPADPGEFTRRAFLNGRIDLSQAEAVLDLVAARGRRAQEQALIQLRGGLRQRIATVSERIRDALVRLEAHLDFGEDVPDTPDAAGLSRCLGESAADLDRLAGSRAAFSRVRDGMTVALTGRPNVGKSSLLNCLAGFDRAIVHERPGTTRDLVDLVVEWSGIPVRLVDTAGVRSSDDPVEVDGVARSRDAVTGADVVVWVVDGSEALQPDDHEVARHLDMTRTHAVVNKMDLGGDARVVNVYSPRFVHEASARTGAGIRNLQSALERELTSEVSDRVEGEDAWIANERQEHELAGALRALDRARGVLGSGEPEELAAADLHRALEHLAAITGGRPSAEILDEIFRRFCIGK